MLYLISNDVAEQPGIDYGIVEASDEESALAMYIKNLVKNEYLADDDYYTSKCINTCFAKRFFMNNGRFLFDHCGKPMVDEDTLVKIRDKNIREFFSEKPYYADIYLAEWNKDSHIMNLPLEIVEFLYLVEYLDDYKKGKIKIVSVEQLLISA